MQGSVRGNVSDVLFEPVGDNDTEDIHSEFNRDELAAGSVFRSFRSPDGSDGI